MQLDDPFAHPRHISARPLSIGPGRLMEGDGNRRSDSKCAKISISIPSSQTRASTFFPPIDHTSFFCISPFDSIQLISAHSRRASVFVSQHHHVVLKGLEIRKLPTAPPTPKILSDIPRPQLPRAAFAFARTSTRLPITSSFARYQSSGGEEKVKGQVIGIDLGKLQIPQQATCPRPLT